VRRAGAGEKIIDSVDFTLEPQLNEGDSMQIPRHERGHVAHDVQS
jgi:hypothetical protein